MFFLVFQTEKLDKLIDDLKNVISKKDDADPEEVRKATSELQQQSLKLFEIAYRKVKKITKFVLVIFSNEPFYILNLSLIIDGRRTRRFLQYWQ